MVYDEVMPLAGSGNSAVGYNDEATAVIGDSEDGELDGWSR